MIVIALIIAAVAVTSKKGRKTQNPNPQPEVSGAVENSSYGNPSFAQENAHDGRVPSNPETLDVYINLRHVANNSHYVDVR